MRDKDRGLYVDSIFNNRSAALADEWLTFAENRDNLYQLVKFVHPHRPGSAPPKKLHDPIRGSYNINWQLEFEDGFSVMIHVPIPHVVAFPDEKVRAEAAAMMLIRENTTIPVPEVYAWCTSDENPTGYGPIIVMEYIEHTQCLEHVVRDCLDAAGSNGATKSPPDQKLLKAYRQMANIMLQLSTIEGSAIGYPTVPMVRPDKPVDASSPVRNPTSPDRPRSRVFKVDHRPVSQSTTDLVISAGLPPSVLPPTNRTYRTSREYYEAMAEMHLAHLTFQHNDAVLSLPDGRDSYVARQLFRRLAREGWLDKDEDDGGNSETKREHEVFKLWCDDMRPSSVLLDDNDDVVGVIDWEMSYFAPASFSHDPPWWLIMDKPEFFDKGLSSWAKAYERHLPLFLKAMEMEEKELKKVEKTQEALHNGLHLLTIEEEEEDQQDRPSTSISQRMARNWENGQFFIDYCARRSFAFDPIYWKFVDKKFFGKNKNGLLLKKSKHKARLPLLSETERTQMETFVKWKMENVDEEKVVEWDEKDAQAVLTACLSGTLGESEIPRPRVVPWTRKDLDSSPSTPT